MKSCLVILIMFVVAGCDSQREPMRTELEGQPLPSFDIQLMDSITYLNTESIPSGKPFALFYFSPYCPYCRTQMDEIIQGMDKLKGIQFYMLTGFRISDMRQFSVDYKLNKYSNIVMGRDTAGFFPQYFGIPGVPYMAFYGKDKKLYKSFAGTILNKQIRAVTGN